MGYDRKVAVSLAELGTLSAGSLRLLEVAKRLKALADETTDEKVRGALIESIDAMLDTVEASAALVGKASERAVEPSIF